MTFEQSAVLLLLAGTLATFALDRFRIEVVALCALAIGAITGIVPSDRVFAGFSDPAVITVVEILLIVQVLTRIGLVERAAARVSVALTTPRKALAGLTLMAALLSTVMNNVGALALMLPVVAATVAHANLCLRAVMMPVAFATLLGGMCTAIGTPANLVVSGALREATGAGFDFFDFAPVGLAAAAAGIAAILIWAPRTLGLDAPPGGSATLRKLVMQIVVRDGSPCHGRAVGALAPGAEALAVVRDGRRLAPLWPLTVLSEGDAVTLSGPEAALSALRAAHAGAAHPDTERIEAAVLPGSTVLGSPLGALGFLDDLGAQVAALRPAEPGRRLDEAWRDQRLAIGDVLLIDGPRAPLLAALRERDLAILAGEEPSVPAGPVWPAFALAAGVGIAGLDLAEPALAFGGVVLALALGGALRLRTALRELNWSVVLMLAAMIPFGQAVASTGAAAALADLILAAAPVGGVAVAAVTMLLLAMAVTPFVNNTATAVALAPLALGLAERLDADPAPLLIAVAAGASIDFLTPFGHHNNTLALGLGGYRFRDFPRTGWPVALSASVAGLIALLTVWL